MPAGEILKIPKCGRHSCLAGIGQMQAPAAVEPLLQLLHKVDELDDDWVSEEIPKVLAMIGPTAIPAIRTFLTSTEHGLWARIAAAAALEEMGKQHPASRDESIAVLIDQLRAYQQQDPTLNADLIYSIGTVARRRSCTGDGGCFCHQRS